MDSLIPKKPVMSNWGFGILVLILLIIFVPLGMRPFMEKKLLTELQEVSPTFTSFTIYLRKAGTDRKVVQSFDSSEAIRQIVKMLMNAKSNRTEFYKAGQKTCDYYCDILIQSSNSEEYWIYIRFDDQDPIKIFSISPDSNGPFYSMIYTDTDGFWQSLVDESFSVDE